MSFDGSRDEDADQPEPVRDAARAPGLDRIPEAHAPRLADRAENSAELRAENVRLGRAVGELSTENAELYKRVGKLEAEIKTEKARHTTWSKEVVRDREQTAAIIADLRAEIAELRQQSKEKSSGGNGQGEIERAIGSGRRYEGETTGRQPRRWTSEAGIATGAAVVGGLLQAFGDWLGTTEAVDTTGLIGWGFTIGATAVAWIRELRRDKDGHRPEG